MYKGVPGFEKMREVDFLEVERGDKVYVPQSYGKLKEIEITFKINTLPGYLVDTEGDVHDIRPGIYVKKN